jgi:hypothetical protein
MSELDWAGHYNTALSPENEALFQKWAQRQSRTAGRNVLDDLRDYDLRGYWSSGGHVDQSGGQHLPDTFKKPNHPTFSDESKYSGQPDLYGGRAEGGKWMGDDQAGWSFQPSERMLKTTHNMEALRRYFDAQEPDSILVSPLRAAKSDKAPR